MKACSQSPVFQGDTSIVKIEIQGLAKAMPKKLGVATIPSCSELFGREIELQHSTFIRLEASKQAQKITCLRGILWITQDNTPDILLHRGQNFFPKPKGLILIEALQPSRVAVGKAA